MSAPEVLISVVLCFLIAWYSSKDPDGPLNVSKLFTTFFAGTTVLFGSLWSWGEWHRDFVLAQSVGVADKLIGMAERCDLSQRALLDVVAGFGTRPDSITEAIRMLLIR